MNPRRLLPYDNFKLTSRLPTTEVQKRLKDSVQRKKLRLFTFQPHPGVQPYEGTVTENSFEISRIIDYRNSFLPVIKGEFSSFLGKTEISVKMRPAISVLIFMAIWFSATGLGCVATATVAIGNLKKGMRDELDPLFLIPFVMFAFGYGLIMFGYKREAKRSKKFLIDLFQAEEVRPSIDREF